MDPRHERVVTAPQARRYANCGNASALWLPVDASAYGADVGLGAVGLKPFMERDIGDEKSKKPLTAVPLLRGRDSGMDWGRRFEEFGSAVIKKGIRSKRWVDVLLVHTSAEVELALQGCIDVCTQKATSLETDMHVYVTTCWIAALRTHRCRA